MLKDFSNPSLITYLRSGSKNQKDSDQKIRLVFSYPTHGEFDSKFHHSFPVISNNDPIAKIIKAEFATDAGSLIKSVFLLVQKDEYCFHSEALWPVTNHDIDLCWQRAYRIKSGVKDLQDRSVIVIKEQIGEGNILLPFQPLFFCTKTSHFFHPPCPACGLPLEQCLDDNLLIKNGLPAYSSSLSRYLFCRVCAKEIPEPTFYVRSIRNPDPETLQDMSDMITGYFRLVRSNKISDIPCPECELLDECFEGTELARKRIIPFSFYPFYMMAFDAPTLNSIDFLLLLSGGSREELTEILQQRQEMGRKRLINALPSINEPFLFDKDFRIFYEVLYLKLSFLGEIAKYLFSKLQGFKYPDLSLSLDRVWVALSYENSMLPAYWNFKLVPIDFGEDTSESEYLPKFPRFFGIYNLGFIWFFTLLINKKQNTDQLHQSISKIFTQLKDHDNKSFSRFLNGRTSQAFAPENIFWDPDQMLSFIAQPESGEKKPQLEIEELWEEALLIGWQLLRMSLVGDHEWLKDGFLKELEQLKHKLKTRLFPTDLHKLPQAISPDSKNDQTISDLLSHIADKWRRQAAQNDKVKAAAVLSTDGKSILPGSDNDDEAMDETVIISAEKDHGLKSAEAERKENNLIDEIKDTDQNINQTVILSTDRLQNSPDEQEKKVGGDDDFFLQTVILSAEHLDGSKSSPLRTDNETAEKKMEGPGQNKYNANIDSDEDELLKTVSIDPNAQKDQKR